MEPKSSKSSGKRWRKWTEQEAREALEELSRSGVSVAEFARSREISTQRLAYWRKRLGEGGTPAFVSVALPRELRAPAYLDIVVGSVVVRLPIDVEAERVAGIVHALMGERRGC